MILLNIILLTGCFGSLKEDASNMLRAKYGETFTVTKYLGENFKFSVQEIEKMKEYLNKGIKEFDIEVKKSDREVGRYRFENSESMEEL